MADFDDMKNKGKDMMDDADMKKQIEEYAKEHNMSYSDARERFMKARDDNIS